MAEAFELKSAIIVNFTIMMNMLNAAPMTLLCIYLYGRCRTDVVLRGVISLLTVGAVTRAICYFSDTFWTVVVGSYLCSCCNPFFINVQTIIANKWFPDHQRALAVALQTLGLPLGSSLGFGMVAFWFREKKQEPEEFLADFNKLMMA